MSKLIKGAIYVVATPIGNLEDITFRAVEVLKAADFIICEDTRVSSRLLNFYEIGQKKLLTYNDHSDQKVREKISKILLEGNLVALISDAGTPLISDPGYKLINFLRQRNHQIIPIPGASSLLSALCVSGIAVDNFLFLGFLPTSHQQKKSLLKSISKDLTFVFFESANRLISSLENILEVLGSRKISVAREITKIHEEITTDQVENIIDFFKKNEEKNCGELVIIVEKADKSEKEVSKSELIKIIEDSINSGSTIRDLTTNLAEIYNLNKKEIYQLALEISKNKK
jgi:16S rRNA (cytidine1402-2'-O)-methyltransferase